MRLLNRGKASNYEASMSKAYGSEWTQRMARTAEERKLREKIDTAYMVTAAATIQGGASEIQRNIIATRGLGLPRS